MIPKFKNPSLLTLALTHRSASNTKKHPQNNERLEFLGDAVLELITSDYLYHRFPHHPEGKLTPLRASLVRTNTLAQIAQKLNLQKKIINSSDLISSSILANTVEAIIGAIYLDQGLTAAKKFIQDHLFPRLDKIIEDKLFIDPKSDLQEKAQAQGYPTPTYRTFKTIGPDHNKTFTVEVLVNHQKLGKGTGKSLKQAETNAAKIALTKL